MTTASLPKQPILSDAMTELLEPNIPENLDNFLDMLKDGVNMDGGENQNQTISTINNIVFIQVQQHMHIALGAISMALALWVAFRIWYDSWRTNNLQRNLRPIRGGFLIALHPAESFPLALAFTSFFQTLTFVVIQSLALNANFIPRCVVTSQIIFPAIFSLSYMHLVFGFEMTVRSLKKVPFRPRSKWANTACILGFMVLLIGTWIPTRIIPEEKMECYGDIIWQSFRNVKTGAGISAGLVFAFLTMATIIGLQLYNTRNVDPNERIAGSRMVYYLTASAILQVFMLPFFIQGVIMKFDKHHSSSLVAEFILFTSGSFLALLHLILRANASLTAIKAKSTPWHKKRRFRLFGPSDLELITISAPIDLIYESYQQDEKPQEAHATKMISSQMSPTPPTLPKFSFATKAVDPLIPQCSLSAENLPSQKLPSVPHKASSFSPSSTHKRNKSNYSIFPVETPEDIHLPAATYKPQTPSTPVRCQVRSEIKLRPTAPMVAATHQASHNEDNLLLPQHPRSESLLHRRSSVDSSATVQIGIRLSNATAALVSNSFHGIGDTLSNSAPPAPGSTLQWPLSVKFHQRDHSQQGSRHSSLPRDGLVKPGLRNNDSQQKPELLPLETAQPGNATTLKPELAAPSSRIHRSYELPLVPTNSDDRPAGFF